MQCLVVTFSSVCAISYFGLVQCVLNEATNN